MRIAISLLAILPIAATSQTKGDMSDQIRKAIEKGREWVLAQQEKDGRFPSNYDSAGNHALVLWTLIECGTPLNDEKIEKTLEFIRANGDPVKTKTYHANYAASLTCVALQTYYYHLVASELKNASPAELNKQVRERMVKKDCDLVKRLVQYIRACTDNKRWTYSAVLTTKVGLKETPEQKILSPFIHKKSLEKETKEKSWDGDNSNAQYGWMGIQAASLLGVSLDDNDFIMSELERLVFTRKLKDKKKIKIERELGNGFECLWPKNEVEAEVELAGWQYSPSWNSGKAQPTMTTGAVASLVYCWNEAEQRGIMTDELRLRAWETILSGIAGLYSITQKDFNGC